MPSPQHFLHSLQLFLISYSGLAFSLSLLLIGLEELIEPTLSCPCRNDLNVTLIALIFIGPLVFTFAIMLALLRPCKQCDHCTFSTKDCVTQFINCLIPPVMWIIILLIDGDYLACSLTTWEGNYVFDNEINMKWCQPTQLALIGNTSDKRLEYQKNIWNSQVGGYSVLIVFSLLFILVFFCFYVYKCYKKEKDGAKGGAQGEAEGGVQGEAEGGAQCEAHGKAQGGPHDGAHDGEHGGEHGGAHGEAQDGAHGGAQGEAHDGTHDGAHDGAHGGAKGGPPSGEQGEAHNEQHKPLLSASAGYEMFELDKVKTNFM
ncbi:uncharacterized protein [Misgurnus anguillicaudatus]|uniref:uncharacterized protein n=1 Tax=Misgurnus anguillicaudatus TaxID=75329 RepID=UPI003CCFA0B3